MLLTQIWAAKRNEIFIKVKRHITRFQVMKLFRARCVGTQGPGNEKHRLLRHTEIDEFFMDVKKLYVFRIS